jgi:hypothetical protein
MFLLFPESMTIPETLERLCDVDFEDWLTAALIESANQQSTANGKASSRGATDLWMLEIPERTGKIWRGSFRVGFADEGPMQSVSLPKAQEQLMSLALNTVTGEIKIEPEAKKLALGA